MITASNSVKDLILLSASFLRMVYQSYNIFFINLHIITWKKVLSIEVLNRIKNNYLFRFLSIKLMFFLNYYEGSSFTRRTRKRSFLEN